MKVAVTAQGPDITSEVDPRFGRAKFFIVVDTDTGEFAAHNNAQNLNAVQGAGILTAQLLAGKGVKSVLTGNCGPNVHETLCAADINVILGCSGIVRDAVERFKAGKLNPAGKPNVASYSGIGDSASVAQNQRVPPQQSPTAGGAMGMGRGSGWGRGGKGMGCSMGRGMGRGKGQGRGRGAGGRVQGRARGGGTR